MKKVKIDKKKCIGCFTCKKVCPSVFDVGSDGMPEVRYGMEKMVEEAEKAEIECPTGAVKIVEETKNIKNSSFLESLLSFIDD